MKTLMVMLCLTTLFPLAHALDAAAKPPRITAADAKNYLGKTVTVCGKVVDSKISRYGLAGHGKPVNFDLDQPEPKPVFFFVTFGTGATGAKEAVDTYATKNVCVTGNIETSPDQVPFIMAADRTQIKVQTEKK